MNVLKDKIYYSTHKLRGIIFVAVVLLVVCGRVDAATPNDETECNKASGISDLFSTVTFLKPLDIPVTDHSVSKRKNRKGSRSQENDYTDNDSSIQRPPQIDCQRILIDETWFPGGRVWEKTVCLYRVTMGTKVLLMAHVVGKEDVFISQEQQ